MTSAERIVRVELGPRSYAIRIGTGNLAALAELVPPGCLQAVVVSDSAVGPLYGAAAVEVLSRGLHRVERLEVPAGEPSKSLAQAQRLWESLLEAGADRQSLIVALGGGVVGDLAGFVAACYARGLPLVQVPTSLLAQVDSSVGGKVGVNLPRAKNMVGAFWQPRGVLIDTATLATLPLREYRSGLAEVIKYGMILDADLLDYLEARVQPLAARAPDALTHVIARSCELKAQVVQLDEREETGLRAVLNYGHTFAHALEAVAGYATLLHGEAVAIGMHWAARLACRLGRIEPALVERQQRLIESLGLPTAAEADPHQLVATMRHDKKALAGRLRFVLPARAGHVELVEGIDPADVLAAIAGD